MNSISYKVIGEGFPIILIHGFCETGEIWDSFTDNISSEFQVITLDLPGFGSSQLPPTHFTLDEIGSYLNEWISQMGFQKPVLIGHSLGGYVCLAMVAQKPDQYSGFGLMHSTAKADTEIKKLNRDKVIEFVKSNGVKTFLNTFIPDLYYDKKHPSIALNLKIASGTHEKTFLAYTSAMRDRPSREDVLSHSTVPILIIAGQNDSVVDVESLEEQAKLSSNAMFHSLPEVGHMGMFEAKIETARIVNIFVSEVKSGLAS